MPPCTAPWPTSAPGEALRVQLCLCPCCRILSCWPIYIDFYLVERGDCCQRTALGIVVCGADWQLLFEILLKSEQTLSLSKSTPCATVLLITLMLTCLYKAMSSSEKKTAILSGMSSGSPVKHSSWCKQGQLCCIRWGTVYLNHQKSYPFLPVFCIFHCFYVLPSWHFKSFYLILLTSSTVFQSNFVPYSSQL